MTNLSDFEMDEKQNLSESSSIELKEIKKYINLALSDDIINQHKAVVALLEFSSIKESNTLLISKYCLTIFKDLLDITNDLRILRPIYIIISLICKNKLCLSTISSSNILNKLLINHNLLQYKNDLTIIESIFISIYHYISCGTSPNSPNNTNLSIVDKNSSFIQLIFYNIEDIFEILQFYYVHENIIIIQYILKLFILLIDIYSFINKLIICDLIDMLYKLYLKYNDNNHILYRLLANLFQLCQFDLLLHKKYYQIYVNKLNSLIKLGFNKHKINLALYYHQYFHSLYRNQESFNINLEDSKITEWLVTYHHTKNIENFKIIPPSLLTTTTINRLTTPHHEMMMMMMMY